MATRVSFPLLILLLALVSVLGQTRPLLRARRQAGMNMANIEAALRNPSFVRFQLACLLDRGACDGIGHRIKNMLPEIVGSGQCTQCTSHEISNAGKVLIHLQVHYPMEYEQLEQMYLHDDNTLDEDLRPPSLP